MVVGTVPQKRGEIILNANLLKTPPSNRVRNHSQIMLFKNTGT
jgi:hypothetical protein